MKRGETSSQDANQALRRRIEELSRELERRDEALEALRRERQSSCDVFEVCRDPIFALNEADGRILDANPAACGLYGYTREEMLGKSYADLGADESAAGAFLAASQTDGRLHDRPGSGSGDGDAHPSDRLCGFDARAMHRDRDGRLFPVEVASGSFVRGGRRVVLVFVRDVSWRKCAEDELRQSEARYRAIVEDQNELIRRMLPDGRLTFANEAYCRFFGKTREELLGKPFFPDMPEEDSALIRTIVDGISPGAPSASFEHRVIPPHGGTSWLFTSLRGLFDESGALCEYQAVSRVIDKRKRVEAQLREQQEFLRLVIDTVPSPIFVKNREGVFTLVNKAMADRYGCSHEELEGRMGRDFNPDLKELAEHRIEDMKVLDEGLPVFIPQTTISNSQGEKRWYSNTKLPLPGKDQLLGVAVDITDRIQAEEQRSLIEARVQHSQKMQALGALAGGIAHDFNNMIYAILGFAGLAKKQADPESKLFSYIEQIESAGLRSSQLVRQILAFSRQAEHDKVPVKLAPLIKEIGRMLEAGLPPDVRMRFENHAQGDVTLGDSGRLHQVVLNLCANAAHAMRDRGGFIDIALRQRRIGPEDLAGDANAKPGRYLEIEVRDSGEGMSAETLARMFEPFFTTKRPGEGTGMGLSVVHGIVQSHGGFIRAQSELGRGSVFRVYLPESGGEEECARRKQNDIPGGKERILFLDDEASITDMARIVLSDLGYALTVSNAPLDACKMVYNDPAAFDLVIVNRVMPGMGGEEFAAEVLTARPDMPVLLITGYADQDIIDRVSAIGVRETLMKPLSEERLAEAVRAALDAKTGTAGSHPARPETGRGLQEA